MTKENISSQRHSPERYFPPQIESSELTLRCHRSDFSASAIARAVEDCDAHILNLNVTSLPGEQYGEVMVDIRVNVRNGQGVARSLERYGYEVVEVISDNDPLSETMRNHLGLLIKNLEI